MKTSINKIRGFVEATARLKDQFPKEGKLIAACEAVLPRVQCFQKEIDLLVSDIGLTHANTDVNGSLLYSPDGQKFAYTKEGYKALQKAMEALVKEERFEFEPFPMKELPKTLPADIVSALTGFVTISQ